MDILNHFLNPAKLKPAGIKNVESIELMLQMTEFGRGVCVLPEWLAEESMQKHDLKKLQIGKHGIGKELYIAVRNPDTEIKYIQEFRQLIQKSIGREFTQFIRSKRTCAGE